MSKNIEYRDYDFKSKKEWIEGELSTYVRGVCYQEGGKLSRIRWLEDTIYPNEESAVEAIKANDKGFYDCIAVPFRAPGDNDWDDTKLKELVRNQSAAYSAYKTASCLVVATELKAQYIGCKKCGSKLARKFIKSNYCPLCGEDMRSKTELLHLARLKQKADAASLAVKKRQDALTKKSKNIRWLVKIEYHT